MSINHTNLLNMFLFSQKQRRMCGTVARWHKTMTLEPRNPSPGRLKQVRELKANMVCQTLPLRHVQHIHARPWAPSSYHNSCSSLHLFTVTSLKEHWTSHTDFNSLVSTWQADTKSRPPLRPFQLRKATSTHKQKHLHGG